MGLFDFDPFGLFGDDPQEQSEKNAKLSIQQSNKFYKKFLAQFFDPQQDLQRQLWDVALGYAEDIPGLINEGADRQLLGITRQGVTGRTAISDAADDSEAELAQVMASSGLFGSGAHAGGIQGISSGTQRAEGQLAAALGLGTANVEGQRTAGLSGAYTNLANLNAGRAQHELGFLGQQVGAAMNAPVFPYQDFGLLGHPFFQGLAGGVGAGLGAGV